ncbi:helicase HerA-like domain-containing protein [Mycoplasma sp. P36-A1]|uniref:helicase HerA-like domain-containing protein n=1 Tax=Mycoplasma sp. P36-A1 TaxID=3252900 RepID=UPI003C2BF17D
MYLENENQIMFAMAQDPILLDLSMANRHGLICGATGTGKTISLQVLAESFSKAGVPVFLADIKGDLSGMSVAGEASEKLNERLAKIKVNDFKFEANSVSFWDVYGNDGTAIRSTISDLGPDLLARILQLNDVQTSILKIIFKIADDKKMLLIDMKDLKALLTYVKDNADLFVNDYGLVSKQSAEAILRYLVNLEASGADEFFNDPEVDINDILTINNAVGMVNILNCTKLINSPLLYSTFMLWLLTELYETLPEVGDLSKPKVVFFFDEAHLLFNNASSQLIDTISQIIKLIRSKGVGIFFITQNPSDIPDSILGQLGNKIQHALHAYTEKEQKGVKAAAMSFRANPEFDTATKINELGTGEAIISFLDAKGIPQISQFATVLPPQSKIGVADQNIINNIIMSNPLYAKYKDVIDNNSAFEMIKAENENNELKLQNEKLKEQNSQEELKQQKKLEKENTKKQQQMNNTINKYLGKIGKEITNSIIRGFFNTRKK